MVLSGNELGVHCSVLQIINRTVNRRLGGFHSAKCVLYSVDFAEVELLQHQGRWEDAPTHD